MEKTIEKTGIAARGNHLHVAYINKELIGKESQTYSLFEEDEKEPRPSFYVRSQNESEEEWMPAILTPEEERRMYEEYY